jgi:phosphatidylglycerol---prolipoprotein diacylglyceryl transferase
MIAMVLRFPDFDPVLVHLGPISIRWYALAYIGGLLIGWWGLRQLIKRPPPVATALQADDFLTWATLGVILGGRLGYILFYQPGTYLMHPLTILQVWNGGMSFHGGLTGVVIAILLFCRREKINLLRFADCLSVVAPVGLFLGRCANFINGELWGRLAPPNLPWAMIFPNAPTPSAPDGLPRHPSQLYQAGLEGICLFLLVFGLSRVPRLRDRPGFLTGVFLIGYGAARITGEFFREPDSFMGYLWAGATMGQLLSIPMILAGAGLVAFALTRPPVTEQRLAGAA